MHKGPITSVIPGKDGKKVYTCGYDKHVFEWDRETGESRLLATHQHLVNSLALSENGKYLASCSSDYTIYIYDLEAGNVLRVLHGHADDVEQVSFAANDTRVVSVSRDKRALVWNLETGAVEVQFTGHSKDINSIWVDGTTVMTTANDGLALVWDLHTGQQLGELGPFDCDLDAVGGNAAQHVFAVGADNGQVVLYDTKEMKMRMSIDAHERGVKRIAFSNSGLYLLTAGYDHCIKIWSTETGELLKELNSYKYQWERSLAWTPDEKYIIGASFGVRYCEWNVETGEMVSPAIELATPSINDLAISANQEIATASDDGRFRLNGEEIGHAGGTLTNGVGISKDGRYAMWGDHAADVHLINCESNEITTLHLGTGPINAVSYCEEDGLFYVGTYGGYAHIIDPAARVELRNWRAHEGAVKALQANAEIIVTCSSDSSISAFDKQTLELKQAFMGPTNIVNDVTLDSVRNRIISVSRDTIVRIYDLYTGRVLGQHDQHRYSIKSVALLANGTVISADYWGYVVIWNFEKGELSKPIQVAKNGISALRAHENVVYASSYDGGVYVIREDGTYEEAIRLFNQAANL